LCMLLAACSVVLVALAINIVYVLCVNLRIRVRYLYIFCDMLLKFDTTNYFVTIHTAWSVPEMEPDLSL